MRVIVFLFFKKVETSKFELGNYSDQCNGLSATTNAYDIFLLASCTDVSIDRVRLLSPISIPRTGVLNTGVYSSNVIMKDVDFDKL